MALCGPRRCIQDKQSVFAKAAGAAIFAVSSFALVTPGVYAQAPQPPPQTTPPPAGGTTPANPQPPVALAPPVDVAPLPPSVPAIPIRSVQVDGTSSLPAAEVAKAAAAKAVGQTGSPEVVQSATRAVKALYRDRGYPVAQVVGVDLTGDGVLHLTIAEGRIRSIIVRGNRKTRASTILQALSLRSGDVYDEGQVRADRNRLARLGIFEEVIVSAQVPGTEDTEKPLTSTAAKGTDPSLTPDRSDGSTPTAGGAKTDSVANTPAGSPPPPATTPPANGTGKPTTPPPPDAGTGTGDAPQGQQGAPLDPSKKPAPPSMVLDALPADEDEVGQVDLVVRVKERQTVNIAATVGYADVIGPVGFVDLSEINLAGTAQRVGVQWQRITNSYYNPDGSVQKGDSRQALDITFDKPALGLKSWTYSVDLYDKNTVFLPYFAGADETIRTFEKRSGGRAAIGRAIGHNVTAYGLIRREDVGYDDPYLYGYDAPLPAESLFTSAQAHVAALGFELVADRRDAADNPHRGVLDSLTFEDARSAFGGNINYTQTTADLRSYTPLNSSPKGPILALRVLGGYSTGTVPLPEFYFIGGYDLLRGYDLYSIYGDRMLLGTEEVRTDLGNGVQGVAFIDEGNAWLPGTSATLRSLKAGAGIGLRFLSPIGPIRFDAAYGSALKTYVTLGQSF